MQGCVLKLTRVACLAIPGFCARVTEGSPEYDSLHAPACDLAYPRSPGFQGVMGRYCGSVLGPFLLFVPIAFFAILGRHVLGGTPFTTNTHHLLLPQSCCQR